MADSNCSICHYPTPLTALVVVRVDGRITVACVSCSQLEGVQRVD